MNTTPPRGLSIELIASDDGPPALVCRGRINLENSALFRSEVKKLSPHNKIVHADLGEVDAIDSGGLGSILGTYISAQSDGCELKLIKVHSRVKDLLNITHLNSIFDSYR